jgi:hypothetical protein
VKLLFPHKNSKRISLCRPGEVNSEKIDEELVMKPYGQVTLKLEFKKIKEGRNFEC